MSNRARLRGGTSPRTRANAKTERLESARERVEGNDEGEERTDRPTPTLCFVLFLCERRRPGHDAIVSTWTRRETPRRSVEKASAGGIEIPNPRLTVRPMATGRLAIL